MTGARLRYSGCLAAALGLHAAVLFAFHWERKAKAIAVGEPESAVELALVEAAPAADNLDPPAVETPVPESALTLPPEAKPESPTDSIPTAEPESAVPPVLTRERPEPKAKAKKPAVRSPSSPSPRRAPAPAKSGDVTANGSSTIGQAGGASPGRGATTKLQARYNPRPEYPAEARRQKQAGVVIVSAEVNAQGVPTSVSLSRSSGFQLLDQAALAAVRRWRFEPSRVAGVAVAGRADCPVRFNLQN